MSEGTVEIGGEKAYLPEPPAEIVIPELELEPPAGLAGGFRDETWFGIVAAPPRLSETEP